MHLVGKSGPTFEKKLRILETSSSVYSRISLQGYRSPRSSLRKSEAVSRFELLPAKTSVRPFHPREFAISNVIEGGSNPGKFCRRSLQDLLTQTPEEPNQPRCTQAEVSGSPFDKVPDRRRVLRGMATDTIPTFAQEHPEGYSSLSISRVVLGIGGFEFHMESDVAAELPKLKSRGRSPIHRRGRTRYCDPARQKEARFRHMWMSPVHRS